MLVKYKYLCDSTPKNSEIVNKIEECFKNLNVAKLKQLSPTKKSNFVANEIKKYFDKNKIKAKVKNEVPFIEGLNDAIDVNIILNETRIVIEIDNLRADQVAKKVLSRISALNNEPNLLYISLCYGTNSEDYHKRECLKYMSVHFENFVKTNKKVEYLAFIPEEYQNLYTELS